MGVQDSFEILPFEAFANPEGLTEQVNVAMRRNHADKGDATGSNGQQFDGHAETRWQLLQFLSSPVLLGGQAAQAWMHMLGVDHFLQAQQGNRI